MSKGLELVGQRFGMLEVLSKVEEPHVTPSGKKFVQWHCRCDCGNEIDVVGIHLKSRGTMSCGCYRKSLFIRPNGYDLTGRRFGKLTVVERVPEYFVFPTGEKATQWKCRCDCGKDFVALGSMLIKGNTRSCGCGWKLSIGI